MDDCTFYYFKPGGKWKYEGRGVFPRPPKPGTYYEVNHDAIMKQNDGMPGVLGDAKYMTIVVIPDEECSVPTAFPRMIMAEKVE